MVTPHLQLVMALLIVSYLIEIWADYKPKDLSWRCHAGFHDWLRGGHRRQCRRCGTRRNDTIGLLRMRFRGLDRLLLKVEAMHAAKQQDWQTPPELFELIEKELGFKFTLDPCAPPENNLDTPKFYTEEDDGLAQSWRGEKVFMNPPYGNLPKWVKKAHWESQYDDTIVVGLLPVRTSPKYFRRYVWTEYARFLDELSQARNLKKGEIGIYFLPKRVRFINPSTGKKSKDSPYFDSMVAVWR